jgi:hypothetical protein
MRLWTRPLGLLLGLITCLAGLVAQAPPAHARTVGLDVVLTSVTVGGSTPSSEVVLSGAVRNTGDASVYTVQVILWRSTERIRDVATITAISQGGDAPYGTRLIASEANYTTVETGEFAPGSSGTFTVRATLAELALPALDAPYALGVDVRASETGGADYQTHARSRVVVPFADSSTSTQTVPLVELSSRPALIAGDLFVDDHLSGELAPGGRLGQLLAAVERDGLSYVIDPALIDELRRMADGYRVAQGDQVADGTATTLATTWLERLEALPDKQGYRSLFASPDVATAARQDAPEVLTRSLAPALDPLVADLPLIVVPANQAADAATVSYLTPAKATGILTTLLDTEATWVKGPSALIRVSDPGTPTGIAASLGRNLFLASEALVLATSDWRQIVTIATEDDLSTLRARPSWMHLAGLDAVVGELPSPTTPKFSGTTPPGLPSEDIAGLAGWAARFATFQTLAPTAPTAIESTQILARAASSAWIGHADERQAWFAAATDECKAATDGRGVVLTASSKFVMSGKTNEFPLTVTNSLRHAVQVKVVLTSSNPQRLKVADTDVVTVGPGESRTVNIRPEAATSGVTTVTAQLAGPDGTLLDVPVEITVEATEYGVWGWVLVVVSGLILVGTTAWQLKRSRGRTRAEEAK